MAGNLSGTKYGALEKDIDVLKNRSINYALVIISSFTVITQSIVIYRDYNFGGYSPETVIQTLAVIFLMAVTIFRNKCSLKFKVYSLGLVAYITSLTGIIHFGFLASAKIYIALAPAFLSFLLGRKKTSLVLLGFVLTYLVLGFLFIQGVFNYPSDAITFFSTYTNNYYVWVNEGLIIIFTSLGLVLMGTSFQDALTRNYLEIKTQNIELESYKVELEHKVEERTKELADSNKELKETLSNLKATQSQLLQSEKMASLGTLTAGIAHEINNPLNYIMGGLQALEVVVQDYPEKDQETLAVLTESIREGAERASKIVKGLNNFSRDSKDHTEVCSINEVIENTLLILNSKIDGKVSVVRNFEDETKTRIKGNVGHLHQVITNILDNSISAIDDKGNITITTRSEDRFVFIEVADDGKGIPKKDLKHIFDPFFTTKPPGEGTGLGLSITYRIIEDHNGSIKVESEEGLGTKTTISLAKYDE